MVSGLYLPGYGRLYYPQLHGYTGDKCKNCVRVLQTKLRGASISEEEKKNLNERGRQILRNSGLDFEEWKDYDWIIEKYKYDGNFFCGYASYYLDKCWNRTELVNEAEISIYREFLHIDTVLGTPVSAQLWSCLCNTTRWDIIKVSNFD